MRRKACLFFIHVLVFVLVVAFLCVFILALKCPAILQVGMRAIDVIIRAQLEALTLL